jgi:hypothetical protein
LKKDLGISEREGNENPYHNEEILREKRLKQNNNEKEAHEIPIS